MTTVLIKRCRTVLAERCPLCEALPGTPCQGKPQGDHLARYLDA
jgi:hypothetical protein